MQDIIEVNKTEINGAEVNSVNSRDIYDYLNVSTAYSHWIKRAIDKYGFEENSDFTIVKNGIGSNAFIDYIVTIDMAKELCMVSNTQKGKETRKYFIEVEKQSSQPLTIEQLLQQNVKVITQLQEDVIYLERKIKEDKPLVSFAKSVEASVDSVLIGNYAKMLSEENGVKIGQNKLYEWLRENSYVMSSGARKNVPYQKYIDSEYFEVTSQTFAGTTGTHQRFTTKITGRGQIALAQKIVDAFKG